MTDPFSPNQSQGPIAPSATPAASAAQLPDPIAKLAVSDKWKDRFRAIQKAGGPGLPHFRDLPVSERRRVQFNFLAFFLGPLYYTAKGLWRQAVVYLLLAIAFVFALEAIGLDEIGHAIGYGFAAIYAVRANISYYKKAVLGETPWL